MPHHPVWTIVQSPVTGLTHHLTGLTNTNRLYRTRRFPTTEPQTPAQRAVGDIAPKLAELTDDVLFGDIWERPELSKRDLSLVTVAALVATYRTNELPTHLRLAIKNGLSKDELGETITHLAFYAGWPNAMTAMRIAKSTFAELDAETT